VPGRGTKYRGLSTPAANNAASGRDDTLRLSNACHSTSLLSFRSEAKESAFAFIVCYSQKLICSLIARTAFWLVIPEGNLRLALACHSAAKRRNLHSPSPPHPLQTVISTEAGHASPSCAAEKPLYLRVPGRGTKYRGLSTPAANNAASGRDDTLRLSNACHFTSLLSFRSEAKESAFAFSSVPPTNRHFDRSRTRFIVLRSGETPVFGRNRRRLCAHFTSHSPSRRGRASRSRRSHWHPSPHSPRPSAPSAAGSLDLPAHSAHRPRQRPATAAHRVLP
jgi:hypothetical protein